MYLLLLLVGSIGFFAMALVGFRHGGATHSTHTVGGHSPTLAHGHVGGHASAGQHSSARGSARASIDGKRSFPSWLMVSPLDIFGFALGAGAAGVIGQHIVSASLLIWIAIVGAIVFNLGIVRPAMSFALKFVSKESAGLEGTVACTALAETKFDQTGKGIVKVNVDDQVVQLLATLEDAELHRGVQVNKGDEVVVIEVDAAKNRCRVSKEL